MLMLRPQEMYSYRELSDRLIASCVLDQQIVGATSLNAFKNGLDKLRKTKMGFFMDCSAKP